MKNIIEVLVMLIASISVLIGQTRRPRVAILSTKVNLDTASVSEGFAKYCPNVVVTENENESRLCVGGVK